MRMFALTTMVALVSCGCSDKPEEHRVVVAFEFTPQAKTSAPAPTVSDEEMRQAREDQRVANEEFARLAKETETLPPEDAHKAIMALNDLRMIYSDIGFSGLFNSMPTSEFPAAARKFREALEGKKIEEFAK